MQIQDLGLRDYREVLETMQARHKDVLAHPSHPGFLLVVEHPPTITIGKRNRSQDILVDLPTLQQHGVSVVQTDRGGCATAHEPGQLVLYPILSLLRYNWGVKDYVALLENVMIDVCASYNVPTHTEEAFPGVWVGQKKIGAVGIRVEDHITRHGLALNVCNDLKTFQWITPCGLVDRGVTTLAKTASRAVDFNEVKNQLVTNFCKSIAKNAIC